MDLAKILLNVQVISFFFSFNKEILLYVFPSLLSFAFIFFFHSNDCRLCVLMTINLIACEISMAAYNPYFLLLIFLYKEVIVYYSLSLLSLLMWETFKHIKALSYYVNPNVSTICLMTLRAIPIGLRFSLGLDHGWRIIHYHLLYQILLIFGETHQISITFAGHNIKPYFSSFFSFYFMKNARTYYPQPCKHKSNLKTHF